MKSSNNALGVSTKEIAKLLDAGIGELKDTIPGMLPHGERLRHSICGLACTSLHMYLKSIGRESELVISEPRLQFDEFMSHVYLVLDHDTGKHCIDPTYSQFLSYVGLHPYYENIVNTGLMPPELVAIFQSADRQTFVSGLTEIATSFQKADPHSSSTKISHFGTTGGELADADAETIHAAYTAIWNPDNTSTYTPPLHVSEHARTVAAYMCKKSAVKVG